MSDTSRPPTQCRPPSRQGGREMSAPRPDETYPFHPPALFTPCSKINFCIYTNLFQLFLPCGIYIVSWNIGHLSFAHTLFQNHFFQASAPFWSHFLLYVDSYTLPLKLDTDTWQYGVDAVNVWIIRANERKGGQTHTYYSISPSIEGQSGTFVSTFKQLKVEGSNSIKQSLPRFLFCYRTKSNSTTGQTPAELFLNRLLKTKSDLMHLDLDGNVFDKQSDQQCRKDKVAENESSQSENNF